MLATLFQEKRPALLTLRSSCATAVSVVFPERRSIGYRERRVREEGDTTRCLS